MDDTAQLEKWVERYTERGYNVLAPAYPGLEVEVEALREDPSPIEALTMSAIVEHMENIIGGLEKPPLLMGHSQGGVTVQILLDHGYGAAGVAIDSVPAEGVKVVPVSQIRALFPILSHPSTRHKAVGFTPEQFHNAFANTLSEEEFSGGLRTLLRPRAGQASVGRSPRQLHAGPPGHLRELQE